jgi:hypothetical protein
MAVCWWWLRHEFKRCHDALLAANSGHESYYAIVLETKYSIQRFPLPGRCVGPNAAKVLRLKLPAKLCLKKIDQALVFWFSI